MEIIIILTLGIVSAILTIGMMNMQKEINRQKGRANEWKNKYLEDLEKQEKQYCDLEKIVFQKQKDIEKTLLEVEQYKAKYNEILKQNKQLLLKVEQSKTATEVTEKPKVKKTKTTKIESENAEPVEEKAAKKTRKKKGDNE